MKAIKKTSSVLITVLLVLILLSTSIVQAATKWDIEYWLKYADGTTESGSHDKKDDYNTGRSVIHLSCSEDLTVNPGQDKNGVAIVGYSITINKNGDFFDSCSGSRQPTPTPPTPTATPPTPTTTPPTPTTTPPTPTTTPPTPTVTPPTPTVTPPTPTITPPVIYGCTDPEAFNYNPEATIDDGTCDNFGGILIPVTGNSSSNFGLVAILSLFGLMAIGSVRVITQKNK